MNYLRNIDVCVFVTLVPFCRLWRDFFLHTVVRHSNAFTGVKLNQIQMIHGMLFRRTYVQYSDITRFGARDFRAQILGNGVAVGPDMDLNSYSRYIKLVDPTFSATVITRNLARDVAEASCVQDRMLLLYMFQRFSVCMVWTARIVKTQGFWRVMKKDWEKFGEARMAAMPPDSKDLWKVQLRVQVCDANQKCSCITKSWSGGPKKVQLHLWMGME